MQTGTRGEFECFDDSERHKNNNTSALVCVVLYEDLSTTFLTVSY